MKLKTGDKVMFLGLGPHDAGHWRIAQDRLQVMQIYEVIEVRMTHILVAGGLYPHYHNIQNLPADQLPDIHQ